MENRIKALEREIELLKRIKELEEEIAKLKTQQSIVYIPSYPYQDPWSPPPWQPFTYKITSTNNFF